MENSKHIEKAMELRSKTVFPNCAETIMRAFSEDMGLTEEQAGAIATNFGGGMKSGSTCGAVTSALMVLGALGVSNPTDISAFQRRIKTNHNGFINCADLLRANIEAGGEKSHTAME